MPSAGHGPDLARTIHATLVPGRAYRPGALTRGALVRPERRGRARSPRRRTVAGPGWRAAHRRPSREDPRRGRSRPTTRACTRTRRRRGRDRRDVFDGMPGGAQQPDRRPELGAVRVPVDPAVPQARGPVVVYPRRCWHLAEATLHDPATVRVWRGRNGGALDDDEPHPSRRAQARPGGYSQPDDRCERHRHASKPPSQTARTHAVSPAGTWPRRYPTRRQRPDASTARMGTFRARRQGPGGVGAKEAKSAEC